MSADRRPPPTASRPGGAGRRPGPSFLGIGAQKSGTTWLHRNLGRHPDVWLPPEKELHYFDERARSGLGRIGKFTHDSPEGERWRRQARRQLGRVRARQVTVDEWRWYARYFLGRPSDRWYRSLFAGAGNRVAGEVTPDYQALGPDQVAHVVRALPDVRVVFLVRNPIERMWSHAQARERATGAPPDLEPFVHPDRSPYRYSDYLPTVRTWTAELGRDRFFLGFMEDVAGTPDDLLDGVADFLGVRRLDRYRASGHAVHTGGHAVLPVPAARVLARVATPLIEEQADELGGPAAWWRFVARRILAGPDTGELAYPLWESHLYDEWLDHSGTDVLRTCASGPLTASVAPADG